MYRFTFYQKMNRWTNEKNVVSSTGDTPEEELLKTIFQFILIRC